MTQQQQQQEIVIVGIQCAATHLIPNLPLLDLLRKLGYRPIVVSGEKPRFRKRVEDLQRNGVNLEWVSAGANWATSSWTWNLGNTLVEDGNDKMNRQLFKYYLTDVEANVAVAETIVQIHKTIGKVALVICDPSLAGAFYGAKKVGAKSCILENGLGRLMVEQQDNCRANFNQTRRRLGLPMEPNFLEMYTAPVLVASPKRALHADLGLDIRDFQKEMPYNAQPVPSWVYNLNPGEPFFFGSNGSTGDYFQSSPVEYHQRFADANELMIQAALRLGLRGIVSVGNLYDAFAHYSVPGQFEVVEYANQPELLAIAAKHGLVLIHGGYGSISEYLPLGGPLVCYPGPTDQFANCALLEALGVGIYVRRSSSTTVLDMVKAMESVLTNGQYRQAAQLIQAEIAALPTLEARILEVLTA
jgi:hypothetical protein